MGKLIFIFIHFRESLQGCLHTSTSILHCNGILSIWTFANDTQGAGYCAAPKTGDLGQRNCNGNAIFALP